MPFNFTHADQCSRCPFNGCIEDRRIDRVNKRDTDFRLNQGTAMECTFSEFMPGTANDPDPTRLYKTYLKQFRSNALGAGEHLYPGAFNLKPQAVGKVEGDVFELLEAGAFWNAAATWNTFMDTGVWSSPVFTQPADAVPTPDRKVAIVKLPRGYDATLLFKESVRNNIRAHEAALKRDGMELGLSSPDIVGVRLPRVLSPSLARFMRPVENLNGLNLQLLQDSHEMLKDQIESTGFLFAIGVKISTRSDRLYQVLFEANILKYLIQNVLKGAAFRFYAHLNTFEGADVKARYSAASLISLIQGGRASKAIDVLYRAERPRDSAQAILDDLPGFHI